MASTEKLSDGEKPAKKKPATKTASAPPMPAMTPQPTDPALPSFMGAPNQLAGQPPSLGGQNPLMPAPPQPTMMDVLRNFFSSFGRVE